MAIQTHNAHNASLTGFYTPGEEIFHSVTHGIGAALSIAGLIVLVTLAVTRGTVYQIVSFSIYGATLVLLYTASTLYHGLRRPGAKRVFKIVDHASIYLLIAGTYTPFLLVALRGVWGWVLLGVIWGLALVGVSLKIAFIRRFQKLGVLMYLLMGWLCVIALKQLLAQVPPTGLFWLAAGGVLYTVGVIFYALKRVRYAHAVWHLFVLGGSICHYVAVLISLAPLR